jgi:hypothetical protein
MGVLQDEYSKSIWLQVYKRLEKGLFHCLITTMGGRKGRIKAFL